MEIIRKRSFKVDGSKGHASKKKVKDIAGNSIKPLSSRQQTSKKHCFNISAEPEQSTGTESKKSSSVEPKHNAECRT
uniref:Uncharacterized protein n=1 Tax=Setaria digitata TaxID=48799 RepID=A0A915PWU9_9BILA